MPITVYWSCNQFNGPSALRVDEPLPLQNDFFGRFPANQQDGYPRCPSVRDFFTNLYGLKSVYDYRIDFDLDSNNSIRSGDYSSEFLQQLQIRNLDSALFSWMTNYVFFTDADSLKIEITPAFMENNDFVNKTILISGVFDIGKWYRPIDCAFHLKNRKSSVQFLMKDMIMYLRFRTDKKINFKYFTYSLGLHEFTAQLMTIKDFKYDIKETSTLSYYYNIFAKRKFKKKVLEMIRSNLS